MNFTPAHDKSSCTNMSNIYDALCNKTNPNPQQCKEKLMNHCLTNIYNQNDFKEMTDYLSCAVKLPPNATPDQIQRCENIKRPF